MTAVFYALVTLVYTHVFCQVHNFNGQSLYNYGKCIMIIQGIQAAINFMNRQPLGEILPGFVLGMWYGYGVYSLGQQIMMGHITRENPLGRPNGQLGGGVVIVQQPGYPPQQMMGYPQQGGIMPVHAVAMPVQGQPMQVQAVAMPVQATAVMATPVMAKAAGGGRAP